MTSEPVPSLRLPPSPSPDQDKAPEVTVNIGRIEVLPPRQAEVRRPSTTAPRRRATRAPELAEYLRGRNRQ